MPVFRMYYKLIKAQKAMILTYVIIFSAIFVFIIQMFNNNKNVENVFQPTSVSISVVDHDESTLSKNFKTYLSTKMNIKDFGTDEESIEDALFFDEISYAITIPSSYEEQFFDHKPIALTTHSKANDISGIGVEQTINTYLSKVRSYHEINPELTMDEVHESVQYALEEQVVIEMIESKDVDNQAISLGSSFNYLAYIFMALFLMASGLIFVRIYDSEIKKRNTIAPISNFSFNFQLWLACISSSLLLWGFFLLFNQCVIGGMWSLKGLVYSLNSLLFVFVTIGLTFFVANILAGKKNCEEALNGFTNLFTLGSCFLSGVFIPQMYLNDNLVLVGSFLPTYWYVKVNDVLVRTKTFTPEVWGIVVQCFAILALFAFAFFVLAMFVSKSKTSSKQL